MKEITLQSIKTPKFRSYFNDLAKEQNLKLSEFEAKYFDEYLIHILIECERAALDGEFSFTYPYGPLIEGLGFPEQALFTNIVEQNEINPLLRMFFNKIGLQVNIQNGLTISWKY